MEERLDNALQQCRLLFFLPVKDIHKDAGSLIHVELGVEDPWVLNGFSQKILFFGIIQLREFDFDCQKIACALDEFDCEIRRNVVSPLLDKSVEEVEDSCPNGRVRIVQPSSESNVSDMLLE